MLLHPAVFQHAARAAFSLVPLPFFMLYFDYSHERSQLKHAHL